MPGSNEPMRRSVRLLVLLGVVLVVVVGCLGIPIPGLDLLFYLVAGWGWFIARAGPRVQVRWSLVASTVVYAVALLFLANYFLRWLYRETHPGERWRWRWTVSGLLIVMLMCTAGIGAVGVVHQTAWLATSPEPMFKPDRFREMAIRVRCQVNLRQIGQALELYAKANAGRYPNDLPGLLMNADVADQMTASVFVCPASNDEPSKATAPAELARDLSQPHRCSYIYVGQGAVSPVDRSRVIAFEPLEDHQKRGMNVLYGDGRVEWLDRAEAEELIQRLGRDQHH